jgi:hypothetical protein
MTDHPAVGVPDKDDGFPDSLHGPLHDLRVRRQVAEYCRIGPGARQLLDHLDAVAGLLQSLSDLTPIPAADEATVDEHEVRHRASVVPVTSLGNRPTGPGRNHAPGTLIRSSAQVSGSGVSRSSRRRSRKKSPIASPTR